MSLHSALSRLTASFVLLNVAGAFIGVGHAQTPPLPYRVAGTVTVDGVQLTQATGAGLVVQVARPNGTDFEDVNGNPAATSGLNASDFYLLNIPTFDAQTQPQGAQQGETGVVAVQLDGVSLVVQQPAGGELTVGGAGEQTQINIAASTPFLLSVTKAGSGDGTVTSSPAGINCGTSCEAEFLSGATVTLIASASTGSSFEGWSGDADCEDGTVTMDSAKNCVANFAGAPASFSLSVSKTGTGSGLVTSDPAGVDCGSSCVSSFPAGTTVDLSAVAAAGSAFEGWSGDPDCADGAVSLSAPTQCSARFQGASQPPTPPGDAQAIPTMSMWGLAVLSGLVAGLAAWARRRHR